MQTKGMNVWRSEVDILYIQCETCIAYNTCIYTPSVATKWLKLLLRIREVTGSNLDR
jgi:hypothetical protein